MEPANPAHASTGHSSPVSLESGTPDNRSDRTYAHTERTSDDMPPSNTNLPKGAADVEAQKTGLASSEKASSPSAPASPDGKDPDLVTWQPGPPDADPANPLGWSLAKKWTSILMVSMSAFCVTCTSSIISAAYTAIENEFNIGQVTAVLGLSLFVIGLGMGPLLLGPLSEFYGRRPVYLVSYFAYTLLGLPVSFANNPAVFFIFRWATGLGGSAFVSVAGGTVSDVFSNDQVFIPMATFTLGTFLGPVFGPLISGFINTNTTQWRWTFWVTNIWAACQLVLLYFFAPETFAPIILTKRARKLRRSTGNERLYAAHERYIGNKSLTGAIVQSATKPFLLLANEYMLTLLCVWSALLLGILYLLFIAFPIVFGENHGFSSQQTGLIFIGIGIGMAFALITMPFWAERHRRAGGAKAEPEARLPIGMVGAFLMPIGMFWLAFTSYPSVHWAAPATSTIFIGWGIAYIYISVFTYTVDAYRSVAASAMAANSAVRSSWAAAFPLFARQMYHALTPTGASALLAGLNVLMIPVPFVFYYYGKRIRARSKFTTGPR